MAFMSYLGVQAVVVEPLEEPLEVVLVKQVTHLTRFKFKYDS